MAKTKIIIGSILVFVIIFLLMGVGLSTGFFNQSALPGVPSLPTALYGRVMDNGVLLQSGEVRCYQDGKDVSQHPAPIVDGWYGHFGITGGVLICLGLPDEIRVDTGSGLVKYPQNPLTLGLERGEVKEFNLAIGGCDSNCKNSMMDWCEDFWTTPNCVRSLGFGSSVYRKRWNDKEVEQRTEAEGYVECKTQSLNNYIYTSQEECLASTSPNPNNLAFRRADWTGSQCGWRWAFSDKKEKGYDTWESCEDVFLKKYICEETDANNQELKGITKLSTDGGITFSNTHEDECENSDVLKEWTCEGTDTMRTFTIFCSNGCSNGACSTEGGNEVVEEDEDLGDDENNQEEGDEVEEEIQDEIEYAKEGKIELNTTSYILLGLALLSLIFLFVVLLI